jgi:hypothetical protein
MPKGPGKWDEVAELLLGLTGAESIILMVITAEGHPVGCGFSVSTINPTLPGALPRLLRETADEVERSNREGEGASS